MTRRSREGEILAGKYRLERLLGRGAVGIIYQAQNTLIGRTVAIKLMRPEHASDENIVERFMLEARAANLVRHPNVVDVLDVGQDANGVPFIVEEFLEGTDLARHVQAKGGRLDASEALALLIPAADAVGYAHTHGVIHRDLKPENVFLARENGQIVPKLLDFGLSRMRVGPDEIRMTETGMTMGSPAYMSPEQIEGSKELDARSDVWALGVILYEVLSGRLPFTGETHVAVFMQIAWAEPTPLEQLVPDLPENLVRVVHRCLRRPPTERYPSALELARDMRHVIKGSQIEPTLRLSSPAVAARRLPVGATQGSSGAPSVVPARYSRRAHMRDGSDPADLNLIDFSDSVEPEPNGRVSSGLAIATLRPPPVRAGAQSAPALAEEPDVSPIVPLIGMLGLSLVCGGTSMLWLHRPGGWPVSLWLQAVNDSNSLAILGVVAALALVGGLALGRRVLETPRDWGLGVTAVGLIAVGALVWARIARIVPDWALTLGVGAGTLVPLGLGIAGMRKAWEGWQGRLTGGKVVGALLTIGATEALFVAEELLRAIP